VQEHGAWPEEYRDTIFITEPILDIIHFEKLRPEGPTFLGEVTLKDREWLRSMDHWFCPIDVTFGPDGAMYVLDFYTPVVAHNDTRGPMHSKSGASVRPDREHYFGRIYRIQHESAPKLAVPDL
jgi:glucose/arabinose dehydrogenase